MQENKLIINTDIVKSRMIMVRDNPALLDRDVAELYGVQTREINQTAHFIQHISVYSVYSVVKNDNAPRAWGMQPNIPFGIHGDRPFTTHRPS